MLFWRDFSCMFDIMGKDFKSDMSTIPSRPQSVDNISPFDQREAENRRTQRSKRTQQPGTVAQFPAHTHLPIPEYALTPKFQEQFWARVRRSSGCWEWQSSLDTHGYGKLRLGHSRAHFRAHRVAYAIAYRKDPGAFFVCHRCDNPKCCNPAHLFLGTAEDNNKDKIAKGRARCGNHKGHRNGNAKLGEAEARSVIEGILAGKTNKAIAGATSVSHSMVSRIRVGRSWRELADEMGYTPRPSKLAPKSGRTRPRVAR